ncbi:MAG: helix-turn-helix domain-containing protein [Candidatus Levybacteria bacterium]|nr:helix-turn-helix domain-containing protein [Candidatus Levybacteria bacterium]
MLTSTLGGLIKDHRIRKRLSQLEVSLRIGWKDSSRLSKIEQGRVSKPSRDTIERIIKALKLNVQEKGNFLLVGGYLPNNQEVKNVIKVIGSKIDNWPFPAFLMDFSFRWLYTNLYTLKVMKMSINQKKWVEKNKPNFLEFPFLPSDQISVEIMKGEDEKNLKTFKIAQIASFKTENEKYQNESWYKKLIQSLMKYDDFRKLWPSTDQNSYPKKLFDYEYKRIIGIYGKRKKILNLHLSTARVIKDPRFQVILCYPADKGTEKFFSSTQLSNN